MFGVDTFVRPGSETNRAELKRLGVKVFHADLRAASDVDALPACQWLIDAAANPSVLAGVDGKMSSRQLMEYNLGGTLNLLEYCKRHRTGFVLLSTSRVYSIAPLAALPVKEMKGAFRPVLAKTPAASGVPTGVTAEGVDESFPNHERQSRSMERPSWQARPWPWNTAKPSICRLSSTDAVCSPGPDNSAGLTRESTPIGSIAGCAAAR